MYFFCVWPDKMSKFLCPSKNYPGHASNGKWFEVRITKGEN